MRKFKSKFMLDIKPTRRGNDNLSTEEEEADVINEVTRKRDGNTSAFFKSTSENMKKK
ncbi:MAG: hypothetical protein ACR2IS_04970 [Nitrososphaeraceae archaeon]